MKVISNGKTFDFDKVVELYYRKSVFGNGYPVEIKKDAKSFFEDDEIEITRVPTASGAYHLVCALTESWAANVPVFDVDKWLEENLRNSTFHPDIGLKSKALKEND